MSDELDDFTAQLNSNEEKKEQPKPQQRAPSGPNLTPEQMA
jgi:hypothetical protein